MPNYAHCLNVRYSLELVCHMNFERYPHDEQRCFLLLESCKPYI